MDTEEIKKLAEELKKYIGSETTQGDGSPTYSNSFENDIKDRTKETENLVHLGFYVIIIMAATIVISLFLWLLNDVRHNLEKMYDFQTLNNNFFSAQQTEINNLKIESSNFQKCLKNGGWKSCFK